MKPGWIIAIVLAGVLALGCIGCAVGTAIYGNATSPTTPAPVDPTFESSPLATGSPTQAGKVPPKPKQAKSFGNGEWLVGVDIAPGRYQSNGPDGGPLCYWQITTVPGAQPGDQGFVSNDLPSGHVYVSLKKGQYFESRHCAPWTKA